MYIQNLTFKWDKDRLDDAWSALQSYLTGYLRIVFPHTWSESIIVPILKKGDVSDPINYKVSGFCKLFMSFLNCFKDFYRGLIKISWADKDIIITDVQFGFSPKGYRGGNYLSVHHHQFVLIKKMYCCIIDFKKAFDTDKLIEKAQRLVQAVNWFV